MDVIILKDGAEVAEAAARIVRQLLQDKPNAVLGLASGNSPLATYRHLIEDCKQGLISFRDVTTFNLDEYIGLSAGDPQSYRHFMQRELFDHIDIDPGSTFLPECGPGEDPLAIGPAYEALLRSRGGVDLQILGIGQNGHIGFNEPASSLRSRTRVKTLTRNTVAANSGYFDNAEQQPRTAITMGIGTIMDARHVLLLATGASKAEAVRQAIEGPVAAMCPASMLQMHQAATVLLDSDAAAKLELRDYFKWVAEQKSLLPGSQADA
ncbi:MAG: glucosamine-6-phosphate deaminase [Woeseiaceae bacterium]